MSATLSAYELQRLENIRKNKEVLNDLGLNERPRTDPRQATTRNPRHLGPPRRSRRKKRKEPVYNVDHVFNALLGNTVSDDEEEASEDDDDDDDDDADEEFDLQEDDEEEEEEASEAADVVANEEPDLQEHDGEEEEEEEEEDDAYVVDEKEDEKGVADDDYHANKDSEPSEHKEEEEEEGDGKLHDDDELSAAISLFPKSRFSPKYLALTENEVDAKDEVENAMDEEENAFFAMDEADVWNDYVENGNFERLINDQFFHDLNTSPLASAAAAASQTVRVAAPSATPLASAAAAARLTTVPVVAPSTVVAWIPQGLSETIYRHGALLNRFALCQGQDKKTSHFTGQTLLLVAWLPSTVLYKSVEPLIKGYLKD